MLKYLFLLMIVFISIFSLPAQTFRSKINPAVNVCPAEDDTIKILAAMVSFQEDRDGATFGNGKFGSIYSQNYGNTILDPLPHDKSYFESHLEFVKNYFAKVSGGNVFIEYTVIPDTFSVSQTMRNYSPEPNSDDFTRVGNFAQETWTMADALNPDLDFSKYNLFIIFHAGVGRDVTLPGSLGNERDIPSLYLGCNSLKQIFGEAFPGFSVSNGNFYITNSMIIPETESREVSTIGGTILFQLSINGLLAASVASHLGLPDLFNTETGLSAIGRFGLMDGQAIFAYSGTFPPEPSAWEKIYLGWEEPVTIQPGEFNINLVTKNASTLTDTVILKVPINSSEYFLLENRIRDANSDGAVVTYVVNGETRTRTFTKDTTGFESFAVDSISGVVTDIDEFDWAIPNLKGVDDNKYTPVPGGGIIIWHIDENIINQKIADNKINTDKNNRGVDVEEADGIQDIGERFTTIFGDEIIGEGFAEDFWHSDNNAYFYTNEFSPYSKPNTNSNSGANSLITFSGFSPKGNRISFKISYGDSLLKPVFTSQINTQTRIRNLSHSSDLLFDVVTDSGLIIVSQSGTAETGISSDSKTASFEAEGGRFTVTASGNVFRIYSHSDQQVTELSLAPDEFITAPPVVGQGLTDQMTLYIGTSAGRVLGYSLQNFPSAPVQLSDSIEFSLNSPVRKIALGDILLAVTDSSFYLFPEIVTHEASGSAEYNSNNSYPVKDAVLYEYTPVILFGNNQYGIRHTDHSFSTFNFTSADSISSFSMADLKNDGRNYILFTNGTRLEAVNLQGASAENFPFIDPLDIGFTGTPLAADFEGDGKSEIIAYTRDGRIYAIDGGTGRIVKGFPLSTGAEIAAAPVLFNYEGKASLAVVDVKNNFYVWNIGATEGNLIWAEENGSSGNASFIGNASSSNRINEFLPGPRVYNYPNPVYDNITYIRYYVSEDSRINIKIFDLAGGLVDELNDDAQGGFDNETVWNVGDIQSGVYLARVEAKGAGGKSENKIIKIAVIK